jgi:D-alanine-D-alanine ligase
MNPNTRTDSPFPLPNRIASSEPALVPVFYSQIDSWARGEAYEQVADADTAETAAATAAALGEMGFATRLVVVRTLADVTAALADADPGSTLIYNLCEAMGATSGAESLVPELLDRLGFRYVGGDRSNLDACLDKALTKARLLELGIPTAPYQVFTRPDEPVTLSFPVLVKTLLEDCSVGLSERSLVWDEPALRQQVEYILSTYYQPALVEQFLRGREFFVSIWDDPEPCVLGIAQNDFSTAPVPDLAFDHFTAKWNNTYGTLGPAPVDAATRDAIATVALAAYRAMGCRDYGRVDLREHEGQIYVLEVNPNPCLHPAAGFAKAAAVAGYSYARLVRQLVHQAWRRP